MSRSTNKSSVYTLNFVKNIKYICSALFIIALTHSIVYAQSGKIIITCVFDGPLTGGKPKGVELFVREDISDLSLYAIGSANNGEGSDGPEYTSMTGSASAGKYIYLASESTQFTNWFGFSPDYTGGAFTINGDDAIELFYDASGNFSGSESVIDLYGDIDTDGSGESWEYLDSCATSKPNRATATTFSSSSWTYGSPNALDEEPTNAAADTPVPIGGCVNQGCWRFSHDVEPCRWYRI